MIGLAATAVGVFGSLIGSFLNVVVFRVPAGRSVVSPPSACGACGTPIRPFDNIPVISWLLLRGRCRDCGTSISMRYPFVELGAGIAFFIVALAFGTPIIEARGSAALAAAALVLVAFLYLAAISLSLALIDLDTGRLPNAIVLPAYVVGAVLLMASAALIGDPTPALRALVGATGLAIVYLVLFIAVPGGMGFGDVKLAGVVGLFMGYLGWEHLVVGAVSAFLLGGLFAVGLLVAGRARAKTGVPFGPWMLAGAWVGILGGPVVAGGYLALVGGGS